MTVLQINKDYYEEEKKNQRKAIKSVNVIEILGLRGRDKDRFEKKMNKYSRGIAKLNSRKPELL